MNKSVNSGINSIGTTTAFTASIIIQDCKKRGDGQSPLYMQLVHVRRKKLIGLKLYWAVNFFDKKAQEILPRYKNDQEAIDTNIIIGTIKARANEIIRTYRLQMRELTLELFVKDYNNFASRDCFLFYATSKNTTLYQKGINSYRNKLRHQTAIIALNDFSKG